MNILLLGSQHGNELLGDKLYDYIKAYHDNLLGSIHFIIGNPKAHARNVRYLESDMNRSYDDKSTYESKRARRILSYIKKNRFDVVLDLHTTVCIQPPCFIVTSINAANKAFIGASSINKIVTMRHAIAQMSLIGSVKQAISIEVSNSDITHELLESLCQDIRRFVKNERHEITRNEYVVESLIKKKYISDKDAAKLRNFEMSAMGFIPILVGENSYKKNTPYLGFKASKENSITL